jgi:hypothetical protein
VLALASAVLLSAAVIAATPARAAAPISSHAMVHTCCTSDELAERIFAESKAVGAAFVRVDVELSDVFEDVGGGKRMEPAWEGVDRITELSNRYEMPVLGILLAPPAYLTSCPERWPDSVRCPAADPAEFGRLAGELAHRARDTITHWEIVNEPDGRWAFEGSAEEYARMLSAAYDGIKARVPEATVVMGGVQSPHQTDWLARVFATPGADAAHKFDVANVHLRGTVAAVVSRYTEFRSRLAGYGFSGPLWVTEHGYPADPAFQADPEHRAGDASQAAYLTQSLLGLGEVGAEQVFVTLRDNLGGEYATEGLVHIDETPGYPVTRRASFAAVRRLVDRWDELMAWRAEQRVQERAEQAHLERLAQARVQLKIARKQFRSALALRDALRLRGRGERAATLVAQARASVGWRKAYAELERSLAGLAAQAAADLRTKIAGP